MSVSTSAIDDPAISKVSYSDATGLAELRLGTLRTLVYCAYLLALGLIAVGVVDVSQRQPERWLVILVLAIAAYVSQKLEGTHLRMASLTLFLGLVLALGAAMLLQTEAQLIYFAAVIAMVGVILLGSGLGSILAAVCSSLVVAAHFADLSIGVPLGMPLALIWSSVLVCWLASRPTLTALDWSWTSFVRARDIAEELRERQSELGRLSKSLTEAYIRLEQINIDLERARLAAEDARRLKADFAAAISHELRTPLNLIIGFSEMIVSTRHGRVEQAIPPMLRADVEAIYRNALHISNLIDDVLDLSRIEAHRMALQRERATLAETLDEAVRTVSSLISEAGLSLSTRIPDDLPAVYIDRTRVKQILINLLNNAVRSTDEGELVVEAERRENEVVISVCDPGIGIAPAALPHLFDEFSQFGGANRRGRSGLGLAVSRQFAELHGGSMWAESEPGRGSTFFLSLPLQSEVVTSPYAPLPEILGRTSTAERPRVVAVVGDDGEAAKLFRRYLDGFHVVALPAAEASSLARSESSPSAVVLTDDAALDEWRRVGRRLTVPTLSCALSTTRLRAESLGVAGYLVKPVSREQIGTVLRRIATARGSAIKDVLIVEDDPEMARLLQRMVRALSRRYRPVWMANGQSGLAQARAARPDVVLLDLLMPTLDGYGFLEELRRDPTLADLPVVVVSAREREEEPILAASLTLSRPEGLNVGEVMRCSKAALECLIRPAVADSDQASPAATPD